MYCIFTQTNTINSRTIFEYAVNHKISLIKRLVIQFWRNSEEEIKIRLSGSAHIQVLVDSQKDGEVAEDAEQKQQF